MVQSRVLTSVAVATSLMGVAAQATPPPSQIVMLEMVGGPTGPGLCMNGFTFERNSARGMPLGPWVVPVGSAFLITDIDWQYTSPTGRASAGQTQTLRLFAISPSVGPGVRIFESAVTLSPIGQGGTNTTAATPAAVAPNTRLCVDVTPGPFSGGGGLQHVILRGVLVPGVAP